MITHIERIFLSKQACILSPSFPKPMDPVVASVATTNVEVIQDRSPPPAPDRIPYPATEENIPKLKQYILDNFASISSHEY